MNWESSIFDGRTVVLRLNVGRPPPRGASKVRTVDDPSSRRLDNILGHFGTGKVDLLEAHLRKPRVKHGAMRGEDTIFTAGTATPILINRE